MPRKQTNQITTNTPASNMIDIETVTPQSLLTCLEYLGREANQAGFLLTAHLIDTAAESLLEEKADWVDTTNVVTLPV